MRTQDIHIRKLDIISVISTIEDSSLIEKVWNLISSQAKSEKTDSKEAILKNIKAGIEEMKLVEQGKANSRPLTDLLNEL
ncbi:MAG: hypothetical protein V4622_14315 [Bacteroidota bacterium]